MKNIIRSFIALLLISYMLLAMIGIPLIIENTGNDYYFIFYLSFPFVTTLFKKIIT